MGRPISWHLRLPQHLQSFYANLDTFTTECHVPTPRLTETNRQAMIRHEGKLYRADRLIFERLWGRKPEGMLKRTCKTPGCINPWHVQEVISAKKSTQIPPTDSATDPDESQYLDLIAYTIEEHDVKTAKQLRSHIDPADIPPKKLKDLLARHYANMPE